MTEEKEIKIKLSENVNVAEIRSKFLARLKLFKTIAQSDEYYDNAEFLFTKRDRGLRIRFVDKIPTDFTFKALFYIPHRKPIPWYVEEHAFKLPTKEVAAVYKIFKRFNLQVSRSSKDMLTYHDIDDCLRKNNLLPRVCVEKKREIFTYKDAQVILDEVKNLGYFIEIETKNSSPDEIAKELDMLASGTRTIEGYTTLISRKLGLADMKQKEPMYLENPTWNIFAKEKEIYNTLVSQAVK